MAGPRIERVLAGPHGRSISGQVLPIDGDSKAAQ